MVLTSASEERGVVVGVEAIEVNLADFPYTQRRGEVYCLIGSLV